MDVQATFRRLLDRSSGGIARNHEVLRGLRKRLKRVGSIGLPEGDHCEYFQLFASILDDNRWKVVCESTMLMVDMIPLLPDFELDHCMSLVLPKVVPNLGHFSTDVRRASLRLLHVYMRYTHNLQKGLRFYIDFGLLSLNRSAQKGAILSVPLLFTDEFANENLFALIETLADLLVSSDTSLFYPTFLALQRLQTLVGRERFNVYLGHIRPEAVMLYQKVLTRNNTANSETTATNRFEMDNQLTNLSADQLISQSPKPLLSAIDSTTDRDEGPSELDKSIATQIQSGLLFGLFPRLLIRRALSDKLPEKLDALRNMLIILAESRQGHMNQFANHLNDFIKTFARAVFESTSYKVILYALDIISAIVERLKLSTISSFRSLTALLIRHLGDTRTLVREHNIRTVHRLMYYVPPQLVLDNLLEQKYHRNPKVREEIMNRVTGAIVKFPRSEFNLNRLCGEVAPMLVDHKRIVRLAALESIAVLAHALGPINVDTIFSAIKSVESSSESYGLMMAVQARLARRELPSVQSDGMVKHLLDPINFASWIPNESDADVEWVMLGSGSPVTPPMASCSHQRRKSSFMVQQPSVSFDLSSSYSDNSDERTETAIENNRRDSIKPPESETSDATCQANMDKVAHRKHRSRVPVQVAISQRRRDSSESNSTGCESYRSDDSKARELWRYYLSAFKDTAPGVGSIPLARQGHDNETGDMSGFHRPTSAESGTSCEMTLPIAHPQDAGRFQRTVSVPVMATSALSDISERSNEPDNLAKQRPAQDSSPERSISQASVIAVHGTTVGDASGHGAGGQGHRQDEPMSSQEQVKHSTSEKEQAGKESAVEPGESLRHESPKKSTPTLPAQSVDVEEVPHRLDEDSCTTVDLPAASPNSAQPQVEEEEEEAKASLIGNPLTHSTGMEKASTDGPNHPEGQGCSAEEKEQKSRHLDHCIKRDAHTQMGESDSSSDPATVVEGHRSRSYYQHILLEDPMVKRKGHNRYMSKSKSPSRRRNPYQTRVQPAIPVNLDVFGILENVAKSEGAFVSPEEALRAAIAAFTHDAWTTKVEGMLAISRLATFHPSVLAKDIHTVILALVYEVKNLRSTVARTAIFTLGDLLVKMKRHVEPDIDIIGAALLQKCGENITFIKDDIDKALMNMVDEMPQSKTVLALVNGGAHHRNSTVRRMSAQYLALVVEKMGSNKCLLGPRDVAEHLLPAAAKFVQDTSALTRYYGRCIFSVLYSHPQFEKLMRKFLEPAAYRNICGVLESIKRRGVGEKPIEPVIKP